MSLRKIYYQLPPRWRFWARKIAYSPWDLLSNLQQKRSKYEPPKGDIYTGSGDFIAQGKKHLQYLMDYLDLRPADHVLDIGSGIGRTAVALTDYLSAEGQYEGFDVVEKGVRWCKQKIQADFPHFNFTYVPLHNDLYNLKKDKATDFRFPYPDQYFDKVFLFSVFTHMQPDEVQHYLHEMHRVLRKDGKCLATFFVYDAASENQIATQSPFAFPEQRVGYRLMSKDVPSANIAFSEGLLQKMIETSGLETKRHIPGFWKDTKLKSDKNDFQDILILQKRNEL